MKISYNWLKWYIPDAPEADKLPDIFTYHLCEVEGVEKRPDGDTIFDLNILPNRAHDLLSHHGIARELAGQLGIAYKDPTPLYKIPEQKPTELSIEIQTDACRRYMGRVVRNVKIGPSPEWVVKHLESIGERSINNVVDATNLCMYDGGQPMHAFDLDKLFSQKIIVRNAEAGESMTTLSDETVTLHAHDVVIAEEGGGVLALAGVKGGIKAEVDEHTKNVLLEVANFNPRSVRTTARRLGILTDAAKRFENNLSPEHASFGMLELSGLMKEMFPEAVFEEVVDVYPVKEVPRTVEFTCAYVNKILGAEVTSEQIQTILTQYGYQFSMYEDTFIVTIPYLRLDLEKPCDMAEEIGRILGYDTVNPHLPQISFESEKNTTYIQMCTAREKLLADGYSEVMTYAFTKKGAVEVARAPRGKEFLRTNLTDGLKASYELNRINAPFLGTTETKLFEIGTVFPSRGIEEVHVAYADKKGVTEVTLAEFSKNLAPVSTTEVPATSKKVFSPWSVFPFITRDVAVWVPETNTPEDLISLCKKHGGTLLIREPKIFDTFTKDGKTSIAVRMVFQSFDRTLTDEEISPIMSAISAEVQGRGWEVR